MGNADMAHSDMRPFAELLPWMLVAGDDDTIVNKDSSLTVIYETRGLDRDSATTEDLAWYTHALDQAYAVFDESACVISWIVHRRRIAEYPQATFPDQWSTLLDNIRRERMVSGNQYVNRHYLAITLTAEKGMSSVASRLSFYLAQGMGNIRAVWHLLTAMFRQNESFAWNAAELQEQIGRFSGLLQAFEERLAGLGLNRLRGDGLRGMLRRCANPASGQQSVVHMPFLDTQMADGNLRVDAGSLVIDDSRWLKGLSLREPPRHTHQGMYDSLLGIRGEIVFSQSFRLARRKEISAWLVSVRQYNDLLKYSPLTWLYLAVNRNADVRMNDARIEAAEDAHRISSLVDMKEMSFGWYAAQVMAIGRSETEADELLQDISGALAHSGLTTAREGMHLLSAFAGGLPGMHSALARWFFLELASLSDLTPLLTIDPGVPENEYLGQQRNRYSPSLIMLETAYNTPWHFNLHVGDLGHALVVGPSRSGKSSAMNVLIAQFRKYTPCRIVIFDKDRSCRIATSMMGGDHIDVTQSGIHWNPLSLLGDPAALEWLAGWIEGLICHRGYQYSAEDIADVWRALQGLALQPPRLWTLGHLHAVLSPHLRNELDTWVGNGALAHYFDNLEDTFNLTDFCCIEMGEILTRQHVARAFIDYAFFRIYQSLRDPSRGVIPTLVYVEECWFMLEHPWFEQKIRDWTKTFAKLVAQLVLATQSLEDIAGSNVFASLRDNIQTRIYLPNLNANSPQLLSLYRDQFGLHSDQIAMISQGRPKRDYFIQQPGLFRKAEMPLDPATLAVVRSDTRAQQIFQRHQDSGRPDWRREYMMEMLDEH